MHIFFFLDLACEYRKGFLRIVRSHHKYTVFMSVLSISMYDKYKTMLT